LVVVVSVLLSVADAVSDGGAVAVLSCVGVVVLAEGSEVVAGWDIGSGAGAVGAVVAVLPVVDCGVVVWATAGSAMIRAAPAIAELKILIFIANPRFEIEPLCP
jgi:hypothetical protein